MLFCWALSNTSNLAVNIPVTPLSPSLALPPCLPRKKPITIYKLRDHETNEEFLEFDEAVIFQTACSECLNIKSCIK